jgi:adenosylhomocysteine nucleosidase
MQQQIIGIMGAMPEEINGVTALLTNVREFSSGRRTYYTGQYNGINTVVVFSRWGKVAAATTVSTLIHEFNITELLFTGVAGAIHPELKSVTLLLQSGSSTTIWMSDPF